MKEAFMRSSLSLRRAAPRLVSGALCLAGLTVLDAAGAQQPEDEVVVTGVPHDRAPGELAQSITVIRDDTLNRVRVGTLGETLAGQLGVSSSSFGAGASRPIIRGLAGARVRTLEDGIDSMDAATVSDDHAVSVEPLVADQIEIFRGPTTLLYGSGAVGGVINTVTTRIPSTAPDDGFAGAFELRGDSVASDRAGAVRFDGGGDAFAWHFDALTRDSDDYDIPGFARREPTLDDVPGTVPNSSVESDAAALGASWLGERGFLGAAVSTYDSLYGIPGQEDEGVRIDLEQTRIDVKGGWSGLGGAIDEVNLRIGVTDYEHVELEGAEVGTRFTNDEMETRVELVHEPIGPWTGAFGLQVGDRDFEAIGEEAFVPPVQTSSIGVFLVEELDLDAWQLSFGGRLESREHDPSEDLPTVDDDATSLSFAAVRDLNDGLSLAVNVAMAERLPEAEELYSDGPHLATGAIQVGDPTLTKEAATHVDVGLRGSSGDLTWSVTAFATSYDDFIFLEDTGVIDPIDALPILAFVQQDADFQGLEAEIFTPIAEVGAGEVDMRLFADYVKGEADVSGDLPRMPPARYGARFQYHDDRVLVGLEATWYDDQDEVAELETSTGGYTMVNADFRWRFATTRGVDLELFVNGTNLTDEEARKHTSFVKDVAPLPGRNYVVGVRSRF
jgi:iron complex outermembrane recepter protein